MSNVFVIIKMCYVHNQWYGISCASLYVCDKVVGRIYEKCNRDEGKEGQTKLNNEELHKLHSLS